MSITLISKMEKNILSELSLNHELFWIYNEELIFKKTNENISNPFWSKSVSELLSHL